jgi:magnesium transporter
MSDSIGTETLALFVRELAEKRVVLHKLFRREVCVGLALGLVTGLPMGLFAYVWLGEAKLAMTLAAAMTANGLVAVLTGMTTPIVFAKLGRDPAIGSDEITTAVSDTASMLIYLVVATLMVF